jgi:hypothetical protein
LSAPIRRAIGKCPHWSFFFQIILAAIARHLAVKKGRSRIAWMWLTAFFGPIPLLVLALLPSRFNISDKAM